MPVWIFMNLIQPIIWLVLFSQLFESLGNMPGFPTGSYLQFFAPGVVVMTALFGSAWSGMGLIREIDTGILTKMLATPVSRVSIILSKVLATVVPLVVQVLIIFLIAWIMGASPATGAGGILLSIFFVILMGLGLAGLSHALAILFQKAEPLIAVVSFLTLPLMFLSSSMMPIQMLPDWIDTARRFNPIDYTVESVRTLFISGYDWHLLIVNMVILAIFAAVMIILATMMFRIRENI